jgi:nucleoside-diphosphate-sugar epimerase
VYGPSDRDLLVFFKLVNAGFVPHWGKSYYSFVYVEDLVRAIVLSALSDNARGEIFFVSDGAPHESDEVVDAIAEALEKHPVKVRIPRCLMTFAGAISDRSQRASIINRDKIREMRHRCWTCDSSKATRYLQFVPKVRIREGVRWTADWYKIHRWL